MSKRLVCPDCNYPLSTCICNSVGKVDTKMKISILQDPTETQHAKNTARLAALLSSSVDIYVGEKPSDFSMVIDKVKAFEKSLLIYPCDGAKELNHYSANASDYSHLILIDGTWRKAKKLWLNNPWLHSLDAAVLNLDNASQYSIRKSPEQRSLSTLEALGYAMSVLENTPIEPFLKLQSAMQSHWIKNQPN